MPKFDILRKFRLHPVEGAYEKDAGLAFFQGLGYPGGNELVPLLHQLVVSKLGLSFPFAYPLVLFKKQPRVLSAGQDRPFSNQA